MRFTESKLHRLRFAGMQIQLFHIAFEQMIRADLGIKIYFEFTVRGRCYVQNNLPLLKVNHIYLYLAFSSIDMTYIEHAVLVRSAVIIVGPIVFYLIVYAKLFLADKGYDIQYGARPLKRALQNYVEDEISELLLDGRLVQGDIITVTPENDKLVFAVSK